MKYQNIFNSTSIGIVAAMLLCTTMNAIAQKTTVKGAIEGLGATKIIFNYMTQGEPVRDSVVASSETPISVKFRAYPVPY